MKIKKKLKKEFNPNKRISPGMKRQFNVGYLFLEKLYVKYLIVKNIRKMVPIYYISVHGKIHEYKEK